MISKKNQHEKFFETSSDDMAADFLLESGDNESFNYVENEESIEMEHLDVADFKINEFALVKITSKKRIFHYVGQVEKKTMKQKNAW